MSIENFGPICSLEIAHQSVRDYCKSSDSKMANIANQILAIASEDQLKKHSQSLCEQIVAIDGKRLCSPALLKLYRLLNSFFDDIKIMLKGDAGKEFPCSRILALSLSETLNSANHFVNSNFCLKEFSDSTIEIVSQYINTGNACDITEHLA